MVKGYVLQGINVWNRAQLSIVCAIQMRYLIGACGMTRWEGENSGSVHDRCGMKICALEVKCRVVAC